MSKIPGPVREFLETGAIAHLVTLDPDGTPHVTMSWAGVDGDEIIMSTFFNMTQRKLENMRRDPRVVMSFQAKENTGELLHPYVVIQGRARLTEGSALDVMDQLAEFYMGPGQKWPMRDVLPGVVAHVTVDRIYGHGPWQEQIEAEEPQ